VPFFQPSVGLPTATPSEPLPTSPSHRFQPLATSLTRQRRRTSHVAIWWCGRAPCPGGPAAVRPGAHRRHDRTAVRCRPCAWCVVRAGLRDPVDAQRKCDVHTDHFGKAIGTPGRGSRPPSLVPASPEEIGYTTHAGISTASRRSDSLRHHGCPQRPSTRDRRALQARPSALPRAPTMLMFPSFLMPSRDGTCNVARVPQRVKQSPIRCCATDWCRYAARGRGLCYRRGTFG
jgi:hypothetical protein